MGGPIEANDEWGGCEGIEPDIEYQPAPNFKTLHSFHISRHVQTETLKQTSQNKAHTLRYTNSYYRSGYCHLLLDWSAEERAVVAEVIEICGFVFQCSNLAFHAVPALLNCNVLSIRSMPILARVLGAWMKGQRPTELRRQIVAKVCVCVCVCVCVR